MKSFGMLKCPMMLVGFGAALLLSPACRAQEVSPDHFTDSGIQDVYDGAQKPAAPKASPKASQPGQARARQISLPVTVQPVAKRTPVSATQPSVRAAADKRKPVPPAPKKQ